MFIQFKKKLNKSGFTLIELLIVVAIIGILAAIAIPQLAAYRIRGYNAAAQSDARNIATGEGAFFVERQEYLDIALWQTPGALPGTASGGYIGNLPGTMLSNNIYAAVKATTGAAGAFYTMGVSHKHGDRIFYLESDEAKWKYAIKVAGAPQVAGDVTLATTAVDYPGAIAM